MRQSRGIKQTVDLMALVQASGVELKRQDLWYRESHPLERATLPCRNRVPVPNFVSRYRISFAKEICASAVMTTHLHALVQIGDPPLGHVDEHRQSVFRGV